MDRTERYETLFAIVRKMAAGTDTGIELTPAERRAALVTATTLLIAFGSRAAHYEATAGLLRVLGDKRLLTNSNRLLTADRSWCAAENGPPALADYELAHLMISRPAVSEIGALAEELLPAWYTEVLERGPEALLEPDPVPSTVWDRAPDVFVTADVLSSNLHAKRRESFTKSA